MLTKAQTLVLALLIIGSLAASSSVAMNDDEARYSVVDTRQGAIKYNVSTGDSWLLDTTGDPVWRAIGVEGATKVEPAANGLNIDDIEWVSLLSATGEGLGLRIKRFKRKVALKSIRESDVITALNGTKLGSPADLRREWRKSIEAREPIKLTILRDGEEITVESAFDAKYPFE